MLSNIIFCLKFLWYNLIFKFNLIKTTNYNNNIKKIIVDSGPLFIKAFQLLLVNEIENNENNENNENIFFDLLDSVYEPKKLNKIKINEKFYKVKNTFSLASGSVAFVYLIENYKNYGDVILKKPIENYNDAINYSLERLSFFINFLKIITKIKFIANIKNKTLDIKSNIKIIKSLNITNKFKNNFKTLILKQLDMNLEAENQKKFYNIFKNICTVNVPKVYYNDRDNLIMEYCKGKKYPDLLEEFPGIKENVDIMIKNTLKYMISKKLVHCDMHYGNLLFYLDKYDSLNLNLIDFGLINKITNYQSYCINKFINNKENENFIYLMLSFSNNKKIGYNNIFLKNSMGDLSKLLNILKKLKINYNYYNLIISFTIFNKKFGFDLKK